MNTPTAAPGTAETAAVEPVLRDAAAPAADRPRRRHLHLGRRMAAAIIDGSSGPVAVNIGHGNKNVLDAMKRQMDKATFAYRLHFENEPAEELARTARRAHAGRPRPHLLRVGRVGGGGILHQAGAPMGRRHRPAGAAGR